MKKILLIRRMLCVAALFTVSAIQAQDETVKKLLREESPKESFVTFGQNDAGKTIRKEAADTAQRTWKKGGLVSINLSQASLNNWAAGGEDFTLALSSVINLYAFYKKNKSSWDNILDFNLGYVKTTSLGSRKNDDRLDLLSKYGYALSPKWNLAGLFNFRSQLFKGYTYQGNVKRFSSAFLSPAWILLSAGLDYKPNDHLSVFISPLTARWIIVKDDTLAAKGLYGVTPGRHSRFEWGAFLSANYRKDFNKIISYKGRLDLFSNYKHKPGNIDLFLSNVFSVKISKWLSASWNLDFIYDDDTRLFGKNGTSPALQTKSLVGLSVLLKF